MANSERADYYDAIFAEMDGGDRMTTPIERAAEALVEHNWDALRPQDAICTCGEAVTGSHRDMQAHRARAAFESIDPEDIERRLVQEWHRDQCMCREFDGEDMRTCHTNRENPYRITPPGTWAVEAIIAHLNRKEQS